MPNYGEFNPALTQAIKRIASADLERVMFSPHAFDREDSRGLDHEDALICLRKGKVYGPELRGNDTRANVIHLGVHVRVVIGGLTAENEDWSDLRSCVVCSVMKA